MNRDLVERLGQHLTYHMPADHDPAQLAGVHKRARRRTMRNRIATGVVGLAALAGLGSLVPTNNDSNALITATQPTPDTTADERATPVPPTPPPESDFIDPPSGLTIIGDGQGGFIGHPMTNGSVIEFARSTDGET